MDKQKHQKTIDVVVKYFYPVVAGIETNILETYSALAAKGWHVTIHTSRDTYQEPNSLPTAENIRGLTVKRYPFSSEYWGFFPKIDWENTNLVCLHNFNVFFWRLFLHTLILKIRGKKSFAFIVTPHGGFNPEWSMFSLGPRLAKWLYQFTLGTLFLNTSADAIRTVSEWERLEMTKKAVTPAKIHVIGNGIEREAFQTIEKRASPEIKKVVAQLGKYIIQIGRVYPIKNYETAIKALALVPKEIKYLIVGPIQKDQKYQNYRVELDNLITSLGLTDRVIFQGVVRGIDKYYLLKHAEMMVHMALWESYCNVVHEGMSQGLVCLVADNTALPYLVRNGVNGYLIPTHDHHKLATVINHVLENESSAEIHAIKKTNLAFAQKHSWTEVAVQVAKLYQTQTEG